VYLGGYGNGWWSNTDTVDVFNMDNNTKKYG
jgi:hypothetical protein